MGNSIVRLTVFRGSWWKSKTYRYAGDFEETIVEPPDEWRERWADEKEKTEAAKVSGPRRAKDKCWNGPAVGLEVVSPYYTVWYNAPEHVWRFYAENTNYCHSCSRTQRRRRPGRLGSATVYRWSSSRWRRSGAHPASCWRWRRRLLNGSLNRLWSSPPRPSRSPWSHPSWSAAAITASASAATATSDASVHDCYLFVGRGHGLHDGRARAVNVRPVRKSGERGD